MANDRSESLKTDSVRPTFRGVYLERFLHIVEDIDRLPSLGQRETIIRELAWAESTPNSSEDAKKYIAILAVLRDLLGQGWRVIFRQRSIFLARPEYSQGRHERLDPILVKDLIRDGFKEERLAQLSQPSTAKFLRSMESPGPKKKSVLDLITDGVDLTSRLVKVPEHPNIDELRACVDPYLQLIDGEIRDEHTGLRLIDIWRYFRYSWAIPFQPTPGRNLFYLIRDASQPLHPVMGIAALGNSIVQLSDRDRIIGWNIEAVENTLQRRQRTLVRQLAKTAASPTATTVEYLETPEEHKRRIAAYAKRLACSMIHALDEDISLTNPQGLISKAELTSPTDEVVRRLFAQAKVSELERRDDLREAHLEGVSNKQRQGAGNLRESMESPLFTRKRALALAEALQAKMLFEVESLCDEPLSALQRMLTRDDGRRAIRTALHANKKGKIGCNLMDLIVCGAIPPYNEILGGKLVAMLMASPQVVHEYQQRYGNQSSEIASRLAGRPVIRSSHLVFLGTTSLYHVGSSQYERIRIPTPRGGVLAYEHLGHTEGYGSTLLSTDTVDRLRELTIAVHGMRRINNIMGEGVSPRLRLIREGLSLLGIPQSHVLKHSCPRLIYGVQLAHNAYGYLCGEEDAPKYHFPPHQYVRGTKAIVDAWLTRWLHPRSRRDETRRKIQVFRPADFRLSMLIPEDRTATDEQKVST